MPIRRAKGSSKYKPVQLFGEKALDEIFTNLSATMRKQAVRPAVTKMAAGLAKRAKAVAPKDSGQLRRSIKSRVRKNSSGKTLKTKVSRQVYTDTTTLGDAKFYPARVELGTQHVAPRPFLRRALAEAGPEMVSVGRGMIWNKMKQLAAKAAAKGKAEARGGG